MINLNNPPGNNDNTISVDDTVGTYAGIINYAAEIAERFNNIENNDCVSIEAVNCIESIAAIVAMMNLNANVFIRPSLSHSNYNTPDFCNHHIRLNDRYEQGIEYIYDKSPGTLRVANKIFVTSSGTAGSPKIIMHAKENFIKNSLNCLHRLDLKSTDRILITTPIHHMYALGAALIPAALAKASIRLIRNTNLLKLRDELRTYKPTFCFVTPGLCEMLLKFPWEGTVGNSTIFVSAGDLLEERSITFFEKKFGRLINLYGSSELGVIATSSTVSSSGALYPLPSVDFEIQHKDGKKGELHCRHGFGFEAYVNTTGEVLKINSEWFNTRDLVEETEFGLRIIGRTDYSCNRNGKLVAFREIESAIERCVDEVNKCIVLSDDTETTLRGKKLIAFCQVNESSSDKAILKSCAQSLDRDLIPDEIVLTDVIPTLSNGKVDRQGLTVLLRERKSIKMY